MLIWCQKKPFFCRISIHRQASRTQLFPISPSDTHVEVESHIAVLVTILLIFKIIWSFLKTPCWKILSDKIWWSTEILTNSSRLVPVSYLAHIYLCVHSLGILSCLCFNITASNEDWGPDSKITKIILAEYWGLLAAVQFRIIYPPVSQLKIYSRLYNTRLSEFNAPHMFMVINLSLPWSQAWFAAQIFTELALARQFYKGLQYRISCKSDKHFKLVSSYQLNAHFLYSITTNMLHYNPQHVTSSTLLILRRTNCIITASGIVTVCRLQRVTIPEAVIVQFVLLRMSKVLLETCWGLL